jgi:hypothetical protein
VFFANRFHLSAFCVVQPIRGAFTATRCKTPARSAGRNDSVPHANQALPPRTVLFALDRRSLHCAGLVVCRFSDAGVKADPPKAVL